jgi:hypothetical protein
MCKVSSHTKVPDLSTPSPPTDLSFIPNNPTCTKAYSLVSSHLPPTILNHSIRVFQYASHISTLPLSPVFDHLAWSCRSTEDKETLMFIASMFHDLGACDEFDGEERFEVCGADAARRFMETMGFDGSARDDVWTAIACHTSPGIAENIAPLARIIRLAVLCDFDRVGVREEMGVVGMVGELEGGLPRWDIEKMLGDMVVRQIARKDGRDRVKKAPGNSWPGNLWRGDVEMREKGLHGVNIYF